MAYKTPVAGGEQSASHLVEVMPESEAHYDLTAHDCVGVGE